VYEHNEFPHYKNTDDEIIEKLKELQVQKAMAKIIRKESMKKEAEDKAKKVKSTNIPNMEKHTVNYINTHQNNASNVKKMNSPIVTKNLKVDNKNEDDIDDLLV